jgi:DNA replication licensing factor MCM4
MDTEGEGQPSSVMWGTDVNLQEIEQKFMNFLLNFEDEAG